MVVVQCVERNGGHRPYSPEPRTRDRRQPRNAPLSRLGYGGVKSCDPEAFRNGNVRNECVKDEHVA